MARPFASIRETADMMGHSSIDQTLRYIGVDMDDMTDAMRSFIL